MELMARVGVSSVLFWHVQFLKNFLFYFSDVEDDSKTLVFRNNLEEKKRQRDHILHLNQIIAQQVMQKSKMVAGKNIKKFRTCNFQHLKYLSIP